jgi:hypothetical protein
MRVNSRSARGHLVGGDDLGRNADAALLYADAFTAHNAFAYPGLITDFSRTTQGDASPYGAIWRYPMLYIVDTA